ncbi:MAG: hypothetical protein ABIL76_01220 [candidate division WOR-3 bacterium]
MKIELNEEFLNKILPKIIKVQNVSNLKVEIEKNFINVKGNYLFIPFNFKLEPLELTGSKIKFLVEGLFSNFLPNINQKGIKFENKILEIDISQYIEDIEIKSTIIENGKVIIEL